MARFTWQDGTLVSKAKVEIDGTIYEVDPEEYSGTTPLSASNLNAMLDDVYEKIGDLTSTTLFENSNGSEDASIVLNDNVTNYSRVDIFYGMDESGAGRKTEIIYNPNNQYINLFVSQVASSSEVQLKQATYQINGTTMTRTARKAVTLKTNTVTLWEAQPKIFKVLGYK